MCFGIAFGITDHLGDAIAIAQIQKDQATVVAPPVNPARQRHMLANVCFVQFPTCVSTVMHLKTHDFTAPVLL
jgi:hypothetical protein